MTAKHAIGGLALACVVAAAGGSSRPAVAQQPACLHGEDEPAAQRDRRLQALRVARQINTLEANGRNQAGGFQPLAALPGVTSPQGFTIHFAGDAATYAFSVKDGTDPCAFAYFSDDSGLIYMGQALR